RKIRETVQSVGDKYIILKDITNERLNFIEELFDATEKINRQSLEMNEEKDEVTSTEEKVQQLKEILSEDITGSLRDNVLYELVNLSEDELKNGKKQLLKSIEPRLVEGVRIENILTAKE